MANYSIYLSSTFRDLQDYRKEVLDLCRLVTEEFSVTAMEYYTAVNATALQKCIDDVTKCDIYILLLANRYGEIPDDPTLNPDGKSYTELEFDTAIGDSQKIVLYYAADVENAPPGTFAEDAGPGSDDKKRKLDVFKKKAMRHRGNSPAFPSAAELKNQLFASLLKVHNSKPGGGRKILAESFRYCCDRIPQYGRLELRKARPDAGFHLIVASGHRDDSGGNLVNRYAVTLLQLQETDILVIAFEEFFFFERYEENRDGFFAQLTKKLFRDEKPYTTPADLIKALDQSAISDAIIRMSCEAENLSEDKVAFLGRLFSELTGLCLQGNCCKRLNCFLIIEDGHSDAEGIADTEGRIRALKEAILPGVAVEYLQRFEMATRRHIEIWIDNYVTRDETQRDDLIDDHFAALPPAFRMRVAEKSIRQLYNRFNRNDSKILDILNHY